MRPRLIFCTVLALGALLTAGTGAGFAQTGLDTGSSAGQQQYGSPQSDVLGEVGTVEEQTSPASQQRSVPAAQAQPTQATPARGTTAPDAEGQLPFTGFAVVTTLLLGLALLGTGMVLRRNARRGDAAS